ncbi:hypothetical protein GALLR39Z86_43360 [Glycomyces algeriensis]|uniref:Uncharacterized protein n=1 Tax=Glycomyces algeriensis TaxID=256037 RepID=A0A9W6GCP4_9ACTN|nr:hypothetical protein GALLR39Z86_43360 [Glycomyces algeriensis]
MAAFAVPAWSGPQQAVYAAPEPHGQERVGRERLGIPGLCRSAAPAAGPVRRSL